MENSYLKTNSKWKNFDEMARRPKWWAPASAVLLFLIVFFKTKAGVGHGADWNDRFSWNLMGMLMAFGAMLFSIIKLVGWVDRVDVKKPDLDRVDVWLRQMAPQDSSLASSAWDMDAVAGNLARAHARNNETGRRLYDALIYRGVSFRELAEAALRRGDHEIAEFIFETRLERSKFLRQLMLIAPIFAGILTWIIESCLNAMRAMPSVFILAAVLAFVLLIWMVFATLKGQSPDHSLGSWRLVFVLVTTCVVAYSGKMTINTFSRMFLTGGQPAPVFSAPNK